MSSVDEIAVPAVTEGSAAVVPIVPSFCTKYVCPAVRPLWFLSIVFVVLIAALCVFAYAPSEKPIKFSEVMLVVMALVRNTVEVPVELPSE